MIGTHHVLAPNSGGLHAHHPHSLVSDNLPQLVRMAEGKSLLSQRRLLLLSLRYNVSLPYAGADIQLAIVGDRLISVDVRRIVLDSAQALSDCGRPRSRPGPHPWPAPPAQRAARLAAAVAPDKLISRDAGGGEVLGQWGEAIRANGCRIQPPPHQQQPASLLQPQPPI